MSERNPTTQSQESNRKNRCAWVTADPVYQDYHDHEWGVPVYDSELLFQHLLLDGAQAGLSWITILKKRPYYRQVFYQFDPRKMAAMTDDALEQLLQDPGIIRNRLKVFGFRKNARAYLTLTEREDFSEFLWQFVGGEPKINHWRNIHEVPVTTPESDAMAKALKQAGFTFVGSTICYAFMQAVGMVNDHTLDCFCRQPD